MNLNKHIFLIIVLLFLFGCNSEYLKDSEHITINNNVKTVQENQNIINGNLKSINENLIVMNENLKVINENCKR